MATKKEEKMLSNLPVRAADFIKLVIKNMRYRKAVRKEVTAELAAHFEDELKGCKDTKEKEEKAKQLIEQFGDPKLLGVLLRRAKKRCRPLWRTMVVRAFQTAGVLIFFLIVYTIWFFNGKPAITVDYVAEMNRIVRPVVDESQNAAPFYQKAFELYKSSEDYNNMIANNGNKYYESTDEVKKKIGKCINDNNEVFDLVYEGAKRPYFWMTYKTANPDRGMIGMPTTELNGFRFLAYLIVFRATYRADKGEYKDSFKDIVALYSFGKHIRQYNGTLIEHLTGIAMEALAVQTARSILSRYEINTVALTDFQRNLEQIIEHEDFAIRFKSEKLLTYDQIQRIFTSSNCFGSGHIIPNLLMALYPQVNVVGLASGGEYYGVSIGEERQESRLSRFISFIWDKIHRAGNYFYDIFLKVKKMGYILFLHPNKNQTRQQVDNYYIFIEKIASKSPAEVHKEGIDITKEGDKIVKGNMLLEMFVPALDTIIGLSYRIKTDAKATAAIVALQRYKQDKGQYPESLQDLVKSDYIKAAPIDPWSDKPLVYKKTDTGFTLYSVGHNFKDEGGLPFKDREGRIKMWENKGDAVFWPVEK
jgi:hypothetical protein